jgi:hypothetical protein
MSITWEGKSYSSWAEVRALEAVKVAAPVVSEVKLAPSDATTGNGGASVLPKAPENGGFVLSATSPAPEKRVALTTRYRPRKLAELVGQDEAVAVLSAFVRDPYPTAFVFAGETGTGKTSAAWALAAELGCNINADPPEWGGVHSIPSGELNVDTIRGVWGGLWQTPFDSARGWRVLIINEVESLNGQAERLFLDRLEDLPPQTVVVFTTNALASLPERFVDRCIGGVLEFRGAADDLAEPARGLARSIWKAETGGEISAEILE